MNKTKANNGTISPERAASILGVTRQTIRNWAYTGLIAGSYQLHARGKWYISKKGLAALLKAQGAPVPKGLQ